MPRSPREVTTEIISRLDVLAEYRLLGVEIVGEQRASGMVACRAWGRDDRKPSAWVNSKSGYYSDSGGENVAAHTMSLWDFAVHVGKFTDWQSARKAYASKAGVEIGRGGTTTPKDDWHNRLILQPWDTPGNDILVTRWCLQHKPGVTLEAIKAAGGTLAYWPCHWDRETKSVVKNHGCRQVIAIPAYGEWLLDAEPVAWVCWDVGGQPFDLTPKGTPASEPRTTAKMVSVGPTRGTVLGLSALMVLADPDRRATVELAWKVEGPADLLSLWSVIPPEQRDRHLVVTNGGGATADVLPHQAKLLVGVKVAVCGDCDTAGQVGSAKWLRALDGLTTESRNIPLPWQIKSSHGEDIRDFLTGTAIPPEPPVASGRPYESLLGLVAASEPFNPQSAAGQSSGGPDAPGAIPGASGSDLAAAGAVTDAQIDQFTERQIAKALQCDVLGIAEDGRVKVYSEVRRRTSFLPDPAKVKYEHLLAAFGAPVKRVVSRNNEEDAPGMYPIREVREALSFLGGERPLSDDTELGAGIWPCRETGPDGKPSPDLSAIVLVNHSEAAHYNGEFRRLTHPRHEGQLLAFDTTGQPWYEFDQLTGMLTQAADPTWRNQVVTELATLWGRWRWRGLYDPLILTGLCLATWVQSLWAWRPRVDILGASNTGKSMFCAALAGLFHPLCLCTSDTTAAGLRQEICNRMAAVIVDEVDAQNETKIKEQRKILEMIRSASRGTVSIRGSGNQKSVKFTLRHIIWVAGITLNYDSQADRNRAITLNLLPPLPDMAGKLILPSPAELTDLGQRMLAVALWCAREACRVAVRLKDTKVSGVDARQVESYAVPASMLWLAMGITQDTPEGVLGSMLDSAKTESGSMETDEEALIAAILRAQVRATGGEVLSIGQAIERRMDLSASIDKRDEWAKVLEQSGVKVGMAGYAAGVPDTMATNKVLILSYQTIRSIPLKGTRWHEQPIDQILRRIPGSVFSRRRVGGQNCRVVMLELDSFLERYVGQDDPQPTAMIDLAGPNDF